MMMLRLLVIFCLLGLAPLAQAVDCLMADVTPQVTGECPYHAPVAPPKQTMSVAECLQADGIATPLAHIATESTAGPACPIPDEASAPVLAQHHLAPLPLTDPPPQPVFLTTRRLRI